MVSGKGIMLWLGEQGCILLVLGRDKMLVLGCCGEDKGVKPILIVLMSLFLLIILVIGRLAAAASCLPPLALPLALALPLLSISTSVVVFNVSSPPSPLLGRLTGVGGGRGGSRPPPSSLLPWARFGVLGEASLTQSRALSTSIPGGFRATWQAIGERS